MNRQYALINVKTKDYVKIIGNKNESTIVISEVPIIVLENTTISSILKEYPTLNTTDLGIIEVKVERKSFNKGDTVLDIKKNIFKLGRNMKCIICNADTEEEGALILKAGTSENGHAEGAPVHIDCLVKKVVYYEQDSLIAAITT